MASSLMTDLCAWSSQPQQTTTKRSPKYHAHFDCFSGAAGDMMLAACLDAADSLPANSLQLSSNSSGNNNINDANTKNSEKLLSQIVHDLEEGLPELKGEFELSMARVWRGMGRIAAIKVDVKSVYNHEAAPVPGANIVDDEVHVDNVPDGHSSHEHTHEHEHKHEHAHQHNHDHNDIIAEKPKSDNSHSHSHSHDSSEKDHAVSQPNNVKKSPDDLKQQEGLKEDPLPHDHAHNHGHEHKHNHSHGHNHSHNHDHDHSHSGNHDHHSHSNLRNLPQITQMLQTAPPSHIPRHIASLAVEAFTALAHAEMHTHGAESIDRVHFHEVGAVDSIVDTVGTLLGLYYLGVDLGDGNNGDEANGKKLAVSCSRLPLGEGTVWTDHGLLPVPAPATMRLMIGMATCPGPMGVTGELVTPTAAALLRVLTGVNNQESKKTGKNASGDTVGSYWQPKELTGRPPCWTPRAVGLGAGSKDFERHPNVLRLILGDGLDQQKYHDATNEPSASPDKVDSGEAQKKSEDKSQKDGRSLEGKSNDLFYTSDVLKEHDRSTPTSDGNKTIVNQRNASVEPNLQLWDIHTLTHLEANIDDATPELLAHAIDLLLKNGAIDAWVHPIVMKKGRPANALHCICRSGASSKTNTNVTSSDALSDNESEENRLLGIMFRHTTTLGIRIHRNIIRAALKRRFVEVQLPYLDNVRDGKVDVKISSLKDGEVVSVKAEFDQCKVISEESNIPLKIVSSKAERLAWDEIGYQV